MGPNLNVQRQHNSITIPLPVSVQARISKYGTQRTDNSHLPKELWICFTNLKLPIASPRKAGVKGIVKSLKYCNSSPRSMPSILLMMFNKATLAQAEFTVCFSIQVSASEGIRKKKETNLICKPEAFWTTLFLFIWVIFFPSKEKNQAVDWFAITSVS